MFIVRLLRWLRGYVKFKAEHGYVERLISLCAKNNVLMWKCRKINHVFTGYTTVFGYHKMHRLARKAGVRTRVIERKGLPFVFHRYRKRVGIVAGAFLCAAFLIIMQQFIWVIEVQGCKDLQPIQLMNALEELGVKRGTWKNSIDQAEVKRQILRMVKDLSWATLNVHGNTATLVVRERTMPPELIDTGVPANVVAQRDGQIKRMEVSSGQSILKTGDTVRAGELIVSGVFEDVNGVTHLVRASAKVMAHVPETITVEIPLIQKSCNLTGKVLKRNYIELFDVKLPLFLYKKLEGDYKLEIGKNTPELLGLKMPFDIVRETYIFYETQEQELSEEFAIHIAQKKLESLERKSWDGKILNRSVNAVCENENLILTADYVIETDIAKQVEIPILDRSGQNAPKNNDNN